MITILVIWLVITNAVVLYLAYQINQLHCDLEQTQKQLDGNFRYVFNGMSTFTQQIKHLLGE